jgi:hypothetical protein
MQKISKLLISQKPFAHLGNQLAAQETLLNLVRDFLPAPVDQHCIKAIPHKDVLVLLAESSAWASRLRYLGQDLLQRLKNRQVHFKRIQIKISVIPKPSDRKKPLKQARLLTMENAKLLRCLAESMHDEELKLALQRLSQHTKI